MAAAAAAVQATAQGAAAQAWTPTSPTPAGAPRWGQHPCPCPATPAQGAAAPPPARREAQVTGAVIEVLEPRRLAAEAQRGAWTSAASMVGLVLAAASWSAASATPASAFLA